MAKSVLLTLAILAELAFGQNCSHTNLSIVVEENSKRTDETVTGCITSENVAYDNLKKIRVFGQNIPVLKQGTVINIPERFELEITNNSIIRVDREVFININAYSLVLTHNGIKWIETNAFTDLEFVEVIDLEGNLFTLLPKKVFVNLPNLTMVSFSNNHLEYFDQDWFYQTPKLEDLLIDNNALVTIPQEAFSKLKNLKRFYAVNNFIEKIHEDAFFTNYLLEELYLGDNRLKTVDIDFSSLRNLKFLSLENNFLTYFPLTNLKYVRKSLISMHIHANPWLCPCLQNILEWGKNHGVMVYWQCKNESLTCVVPVNRRNICTKRPDTDFTDEIRYNFVPNCKKITV